MNRRKETLKNRWLHPLLSVPILPKGKGQGYPDRLAPPCRPSRPPRTRVGHSRPERFLTSQYGRVGTVSNAFADLLRRQHYVHRVRVGTGKFG
jgi:hypothetical protein